MLVKRRSLIQPTKKMNCPAYFRVARVLFIRPDVVSELRAVSMGVTSTQGRSGKSITGRTKLVSAIQTYLASASVEDLVENYLFYFPSDSDHQYHHTGRLAKLTSLVDDKVRRKVKELYMQGHDKVEFIQRMLEMYVEHELHQTDRLYKAFFPDKRTICNIIWSVKLKSRWSKFDLVNVAQFVKNWANEADHIYFRAPVKSSRLIDEETDCNITHASSSLDGMDDVERICGKWTNQPADTQLLFVYQSADMAHLYRLYGPSGILMDATYKTCNYDLPLYCVSVKTNCGYQPVCMFVSQRETTEAVAEALGVLKDWNEDVAPRYGMTDYAWEEINALNQVWPDMKVFLCDFHREQAWVRWCRVRSNVGQMSEDDVKARFRAIARAQSQQELDEAYMQLSELEHYAGSAVQRYFDRIWWPEVERWSRVYEPLDLLYHTNNGTERLHETLKYGYLRDYKKCSLSELLEVLTKRYLPDRFREYMEANVRMMASHKPYHQELDVALHERPEHVVTLLKEAEGRAVVELSARVRQVSEREFVVPSDSKPNATYTVIVDGSKSSCTCLKFWKTKVPCKHFFLVGLKEPDYHPYRRLNEILSNPVYCIDPVVIEGAASGEMTPTVARLSSRKPAVVTTTTVKQKETDDSTHRKLMSSCDATWRSTRSMLWQLPVETLKEYVDKFVAFMEDVKSAVPVDECGMTRHRELREEHRRQGPVCESEPVVQEAVGGKVGDAADGEVEVIDSSEAHVLGDEISEQQPVSDHTYCSHIVEGDHTYCAGKGEKVLCVGSKRKLQEVLDCDENHLKDLPVRKRSKQVKVGAAADRERLGRENEFCSGVPVSYVRDNSNIRRLSLRRASDLSENRILGNGFKISVSDLRRQCQRGEYFGDDLMNCAQEMIREEMIRQGKWAGGLQDTVLGAAGRFDVQREGVQIVYTGAEHWVTVKTLDCNIVELYDSQGRDLTLKLCEQIADLLGSWSNEIIIKRMSVQKQGVNDCGPMAIAFAWALVQGLNPEKQTFANPRHHVLQCMLNGQFTDFPSAVGSPDRVPFYTFTVPPLTGLGE